MTITVILAALNKIILMQPIHALDIRSVSFALFQDCQVLLLQVIIQEPKDCIPLCSRLPPQRQDMEDWVRVGKVC